MAISFVAAVQVLLSVPVAGEPVRFGVPLPTPDVARGLALAGPGALQWRHLVPPERAAGDLQWVELAIVAPRGTARIVAGGAGPCADGRGPAFVREVQETLLAHGRATRTVWRWCDGRVDARERLLVLAPWQERGEVFTVGEAVTSWSAGALARAAPVPGLPRELFVRSGLLPPPGALGAEVRRRLQVARAALRELPGARGAGDYARSGEVVTNQEYDTTFALLRLACATGDEAAFAQARRGAEHLVDRDLDLRTGLPFRHGHGHRVGVPEPGHVWVRGLLWTALWTADDDLLACARSIAGAIAAAVPLGEGRLECARDYAWPLAELEATLAILPDAVLARAADRLAASIDRRWDAALRTWRFGEGELGAGAYLERAWITGGLVIPALAAHLRRRPHAAMQEHVAAAQRQLHEQMSAARRGLPTHWCWVGGRLVREHRVAEVAAAALMLDGLPLPELRRLVRRTVFRTSLGDLPRPDDPDLPTSFTLVGRCDWVWR